MLTINLPSKSEKILEELARDAGKDVAAFARDTLLEYLEDMEDAQVALNRLNDPNAEYITTDELKKSLGL
jgi:predicted DNA-binding protein